MSEPAPSRGRVLVVDDEAFTRRGLQKLLELEGFSADVAEDGPSALRRVAEGAFDVVVTDLRMPNMDGLTLLSRLREEAPDLPVIVMSVFGAGVARAREAGAAASVLKPVDLDALTGAIDDVIRQKRGG